MSESDANEPANETRWLTTGEAAEILGTSIATVRRMADSGVLVSKRLPSWSSRGADRRGYELDGHRRVSEASVEYAKAKRAEQERQARAEQNRLFAARAASQNPSPDTLDT